MPEGHTIHRAARDQSRFLAGQVVSASSPQGRFAAGAKRLDGRRCLGVEAFGKHLIHRFEGAGFLHLHLGLFGRFRSGKLPAPPPRGAVRVRLVSATHVVDVNGPTICEILDDHGLQTLIGRIGPDPLRADAEPERAFKRLSTSRAPVGRLIMDQSVMAGIGNIYRTEILWRQGIHPLTPGRMLDRQAFDRLWRDAVALLELGVKRKAIITVDGQSPSKSRYRERVNIFGKDRCPKCDGRVQPIEIDGRRAFFCGICQPKADA